MAPSHDGLPDALAGAVADGASVDWRTLEVSGTDATLIEQLRVIAAMRRRPATAVAEGRPVVWKLIAACYVLGVGVALAKVVTFLAVVATVLPNMDPRPLVFAAIVAVFGGGGALMMAGGARDRRLALLGGFYVTIASAFAGPFPVDPPGALGAIVDVLTWCKPEAYSALAVWTFAWTFPTEPSGRARRVAAAAIVLAAVAGVLLFAANLVRMQDVWPIEHPTVLAVLGALNRKSVTSWFWPVIAVTTGTALPFLAYRATFDITAHRRHVQRFLGALAVGLVPMLIVAAAAPLAPFLQASPLRQLLGVGLYLGLFSIVPMTAHAVTVNRIMDLQFVIRATLQYALARYAIWAAILAPLTYLALDVFVNRGLTFLEYLNTRHPGAVFALSGVGFVALTFRPQLVRAVDRWFAREPLDSSQALARLEHRFRGSEHLRDISAALAEVLAGSLNAGRVSVFLRDEAGASLVTLEGTAPAIATNAVLVDLLASTRTEVQIDVGSSLLRLLPDSDQDWLDATGARLLAPLLGSSGSLLGVVAIAASTNDLPYTDRHVSLVTAMCGHAALQLENRWLRQAGLATPSGLAPPRGGVAWQDEPAVWCATCSAVLSAETQRCRCGTATRQAVLPLFVNGKFRLQRFLGAGGTGVVYLATDLMLDREVAIKTLPPMRREYAERLRREARAMASVRHPNLATIYGAEEWHDTPLLVVEYLEGGTLLDWLARGPMAPAEVLDLGITLADVLDRVHGSGVLHRDIKPSNIGYSAEGVPKLLDFGLAAMLDRSAGLDPAPVVLPADPAELAARFRDVKASSTLTITHQVVGTPLYLSPEALAGQPPQASFDLWSLTMVLYEALGGRHPFGGRSVPEVVHAVQHVPVPDVRDLRPDCPAAVAVFLKDALSPAAARRPASAAALRTQLRSLRTRLDQAI